MFLEGKKASEKPLETFKEPIFFLRRFRNPPPFYAHPLCTSSKEKGAISVHFLFISLCLGQDKKHLRSNLVVSWTLAVVRLAHLRLQGAIPHAAVTSWSHLTMLDLDTNMLQGLRFHFQVFWHTICSQNYYIIAHSLRIYPYPMVWPLPRPWSETMVSIPLWAQKTPRNNGFSGSGAPIFGFGLADPAPKG